MITHVILFLLFGAAISWLICANADRLANRLGLMDFPDPAGGRKTHQQPTPLVGGLVLMLVVPLPCAALYALSDNPELHAVLLWYVTAVVGLSVTGLLDDRFGLSAWIRLGIAAAILLAAVSQVPDFSISFLLLSGQDRLLLFSWPAGIAFTLLCFVGLINAVNMADGKNGLVTGQAIIWAMLLLLRAPAAAGVVAAALLGALLVLFLFNMQGKVFLGDGGSYGLSAVFGLLAIYIWNLSFESLRADDIALVFAVPVLDTIRLIVHRLLRRRSPLSPGQDHLHHYLSARWGWPRPLIWILLLVAVPNLGAILIPGSAPLWAAVTVVGYFALLGLSRMQPAR